MADRDGEMLEALREIARWTRELAMPVLQERAAGLLDTDGKKRVYAELAEGASSLTAIERATGVNHNDVRRWIEAWELQGLVEPNRSPPRARFTLTELGIQPLAPRQPRAARDR